MHKVNEVALLNKRVLLRCDLNVPLRAEGDAMVVADDTRLRASVPSMRYILEQGGKLVICSHLGRPKGIDGRYSLQALVEPLEQALKQRVRLCPIGAASIAVAEELGSGEVLLLENLRFHAEEVANDAAFSACLAAHAEVYVNDAFGTAHRAHASVVGVAGLVQTRAMGLLMAAEVAALTGFLTADQQPFMAIIGGAKVRDKLPLLGALLHKVEALLLGGGMAHTFVAAQGGLIGSSLVEPDQVPLAKELLEEAARIGKAVYVPEDVLVRAEGGGVEAVPAGAIPSGLQGLDIGPTTQAAFGAVLQTARRVFWNGPMGVCEEKAFAGGTAQIAQAIGRNKSVFSVVGGGDSIAALHTTGTAPLITHISTGGGALLQFVEGKPLPALTALA